MNQLVTVPAFTVSDVERVALAIAKGGLFGSTDPNAVLTLCLLAQAEGQHPAVVFRDYHIIKGRPAKKAEAMLRDFIQAGGKVEWHQLDDTCADATFTHPSGSARISWDHERAKKAQIVNGMYQKFPRQMLRSRVISEGIRTVYPGATSGLYEEGEVVAMGPDTPTADAETGEIIEAERVKVPGIHAIKQRLNALMREGNAATDPEAFSALVKANRDDLKTIRDAGHEYWTGDGGDSEGFGAWIERRRDELAADGSGQESVSFQLLLSTLAEVETRAELQGWLGKNGDVVEQLDGEESRRFEAAYIAKETEIMAPRIQSVIEAG